LEAATGRRLVPKKEMAERALTILSSRHGGNATTQATDVLQSHLTDVTMPLDPMLRAALRAMLEPYPSRRKDTGALLQAALLSGQVTTAVRHAANKEVLDAISTATTQIVATISQAEARLAEQVEAGNAVVLNQLCAIQRTPLPQLLATTRQQHLEMVCLMDENADNAALRSKAAEAAAEVRAALGQVAGRIEGQDPALVAMMADLVKAQPAQQEAPSGVLSKLDALMRRMDAMGDQFGKLNAKVDTMHAKQVEAFQQLQVKLDQLLLNGHEQVFTHFMMKPLPSKGRMGKALAKMHPKNWLVSPMLIVPLYKDPSGRLVEAPVDNKFKGFKVSKPTEFVKKHPRMVQLGMLALKIGIKVAATQLAVSIPAEALNAIGPNTDGLINEMLVNGFEAMKEHLEDDDNMEDFEDMLDDVIASTFEAPNDAPDDALEYLMGNDKFKQLSRLEYTAFSTWMDGAHPKWKGECGLVSEINPATGRAEYVPPGTY